MRVNLVLRERNIFLALILKLALNIESIDPEYPSSNIPSSNSIFDFD
jgi:hypothetical protein